MKTTATHKANRWAPRLATGLGLCMVLAIASGASVIDRPFLRAASVVIVMGGTDFSENAGQALFVMDFNLLDNVPPATAGDDIIAQDGVTTNFNTGQFNAISNGFGSGYEFDIQNPTSGGVFTSVGPHQTLDANDIYSEFGLDNSTDIELSTNNRASIFLVASNAAFDIYAQASNLVATGDFSSLGYNNIRYRLRLRLSGGSGIWQYGGQAQNPSAGGSGIMGAINDLSDMSAGPTKVFDGGRRTAQNPGTLLQHAIGYQSRYRITGAGGTLGNYDLSMGTGTLGATVTYTIYTP